MTTKTIKGASKAPTSPVYEGVVSSGKETVEATLKAFTLGKDRAEQVAKSYEDMAEFNKGTVDAIVTAGNVAAKGIEAINAEVLAFSKTSLEDSLAATKAVMSAKTLNEFVELQSKFAKASLDTYLQQTAKLGELGTKLAQDAFGPINARVQFAVERFVKPLAA